MRCFYCMEEYDEDLDVICPYCGNDIVGPTNDNTCLSAGTVLKKRYVLGRVLGDGGFGITYIGYDKALKRKVAVKEFFPNECVTRQKGEVTVTPLSGERAERYANGLQSFQEEAQRLANLGSIEGVVNVYDVFAANGTAYIVMEYLSGDTVAQMVEKSKMLGFGKTMNIIVPVLRSLIKVHQAGVIHRDISPQNIIRTKEGKIVLIDFGAARQNSFSMSKSASIILKQGYAPIEQYDNKLEQNSWTDVYAVAATMYYMLTGVTPDFANTRLLSDTLAPVSELRSGLPPKLDEILRNAMAVRPEERTQTAQELLDQIMTLKDFKPDPSVKRKQKRPDKVMTQKISKSQWKSYTGTVPSTYEDPAQKEYKPKVIVIDSPVAEPKTQDEKPREEVAPLVPEKPKTKVSLPLVAGVLISIIVLTVLFSAAYLDRKNNITVPDFVGQNIDSILSDSQYDFDFEVINIYDPDVEVDVVVSQSPVATSRHVKKDSHVRLTVNSLDYEVTIPVLSKMSQTVAVNTLKSLYLDSQIVIVNNDDYADGTVVSTEPANGSKIPVKSVVTLYIAENSVAVPNLTGKTLQEATNALEDCGLAVGEIGYDYSDDVETGCVVAQGIEQNTKVLKGTMVPVTISSGRPIPITLSATVDLSGLKTPFTITVYCDGNQEAEKKRYSLAFDNTFSFEITRNINEGSKEVTVYIDDELYQTYSFDFENAYASLVSQNEVSAAKKTSDKSSDNTSSSQIESEAPIPGPIESEAPVSSVFEIPSQTEPISSEAVVSSADVTSSSVTSSVSSVTSSR